MQAEDSRFVFSYYRVQAKPGMELPPLVITRYQACGRVDTSLLRNYVVIDGNTHAGGTAASLHRAGAAGRRRGCLGRDAGAVLSAGSSAASLPYSSLLVASISS